MNQIGINGLGRIGKLLLIQLIEANSPVSAINIPDFDIVNLEEYLKNDSTHNYNLSWEFKILSENKIMINNKLINILNSRDAKKLNWKEYGVNYLIDASGVYLTQEKAKEHNVDYFIMCAPAKDNTPSFMVYGNEDKYRGENIVNNVSCTSNSIIPILKIIDDKFIIKDANFITIHSTTASQHTMDTSKCKNRTSRSMINNIIPHTTGASSSIYKILPNLQGKVFGTSVRVPTSNVSLIDLNIRYAKKHSLGDILNELSNHDFIQIDDNKFRVSTDYNTTSCPCIIDKKACMNMYQNQVKLSIWYDNEWSYASKVILLLNHMIRYNMENNNFYERKYFIENKELENKKVILRLDWNVPIIDNKIQDYFRIKSTMKTIDYIISKKPYSILIVSHLGRPKGYDEKYSFKNIIDQISNLFEEKINTVVVLLESGLSSNTNMVLSCTNKNTIYLLDNIRFIEDETIKTSNFINTEQAYLSLGDVYINDAFASSHRDHMSITSILKNDWGYGYLIQKEIKCLGDIITNINNEKILAIMGGAKMDDKLPLLESLSKNVDGIYIGGGNINSLVKDKKYRDYLDCISNNRAKIYSMIDGLCSVDLEKTPSYSMVGDIKDSESFYDIGMQSIVQLTELIKDYDTIFWNGTLGLVENKLYKHGSISLVNTLMQSNKKVIIGGGDTACFVNRFNHNFYYVSTGGGATLDFLSNDELVGLPFKE